MQADDEVEVPLAGGDVSDGEMGGPPLNPWAVTEDSLVEIAGGRPVGMIDFDFAGPSTRLLDIATTLRYWAPLSPPADRDPALEHVDPGRRARMWRDGAGDLIKRAHAWFNEHRDALTVALTR